MQGQDLLDDGYSIGGQTFIGHLFLYFVQADFIQLVDGDGDVHHFVGGAGNLGEAREDLAVVDVDAHAHAQFGKDGVHHLHQLQFVHLASAADNVHVALVEFTVAAFLGTVGPPDGLDLEALEGEGNVALMLHHVPGEGDREVIAEAFFAHLGGEGLGEVHVGKGVPGIKDAEQQFVSFLPILAQQSGQVLHGRRLDFLIPIGEEDAADGAEYVVAAGHLLLAEVPRSLWNGRFLDGHFF